MRTPEHLSERTNRVARSGFVVIAGHRANYHKRRRRSELQLDGCLRLGQQEAASLARAASSEEGVPSLAVSKALLFLVLLLVFCLFFGGALFIRQDLASPSSFEIIFPDY